MTPLKALLVGTGVIAPQHAIALRSQTVTPVEIVGAVDPATERLDAFRAEHDIPAGFASLEEALEQVQPDLVHLSTPPFTHTPQVIAALDAGAWVLCEKPLCGSLAELDEIAAVEARSPGHCVSICQWRFGAAGRHMKSLVESGALGRLLTGVCQTLFYRDQAYYDVAWRGRWETELGGATTTNGIHALDFVLSMQGDWQEVSAMIGTLNHEIEVEDVAMGTIRFDSGAIVSVGAATVAPRQATYIRFDYERATVEVDGRYWYGNDDWRFTPAPDRDDAPTWSPPASYDATHTAQLTEVLRSRLAGEVPEATPADMRATLELLAAIYKSAATGALVRRGEIDPADPFYLGVAAGMASVSAGAAG